VTREEEIHGGAPEPGGLAKDVARLYTYAHIEEGNYRVFSRGARPLPASRPMAEVAQPQAPAQPTAEAPVQTEATPPATIQAPTEAQSAAPAAAATAPTSPRITIQSEPAPIPTEPIPIRTPAPIPASARPIEVSPESEPWATHKTAIAICSVAGGTGKTTFAANIGRLLSAQNEHVLLVDASGSTLLPFYFGAEDMRGGIRTFLAPEPGSLPMHVIGNENANREWLQNDVKPAMRTVQRTIFDLGPASFSLLPEIFPMCAVVLVPLLTDLNSIMSLPRIEAYHRAMRERGEEAPMPVYVSNKFDAASARERNGRDLIAREVGDRLLPISIRRSPDVSEAIAQRMTVADYAAQSAIAQEFLQLALWLKKAAPVTRQTRVAGRWSEA
jgi:cellulose biosynthesis protein BcsQ